MLRKVLGLLGGAGACDESFAQKPKQHRAIIVLAYSDYSEGNYQRALLNLETILPITQAALEEEGLEEGVDEGLEDGLEEKATTTGASKCGIPS